MLELHNLTVQAEGFTAKQCSFRVERGACHVLFGPTGSGKTVLLEAIAGLRKPLCGSITLNHQAVTHLPPEKRRIAYVPQDLALFPSMTVLDNIAYSLRIKGAAKKEIGQKVSPVAVLLEIEHLLGRNIHSLSGGERQRVALARALVSESSLMLLDEPFASLHSGLRRELWYLLNEIRQKHRQTFLLVTHDLDEALFLAANISIIAAGVILQTGPKTLVFRHPATVEAAKIMGVENFFRAVRVDSAGERKLYLPDIDHSIKIFGEDCSVDMPHGCQFTAGVRAAAVRMVPNRDGQEGHSAPFTIEAVYEKTGTAVAVLKARRNSAFRVVVEEPLRKNKPEVGQPAAIMLAGEVLAYNCES